MRVTFRHFQWPLVACFIILSALLIPTVRGALQGAFATPTRLVRTSGESVANSFRLILSIPSLAQENDKLRSELREQTALKVKQQELDHENALLRQELSLRPRDQSEKLLAAQVITRSASVTQQYITVDKGSEDGFVKGMAVISQGYFIGQVDEAQKNTSRIRLITSVESLVPVILQNSRSLALLKGGASGLLVDEIPRDVAIAADEAIVTASVGDIVRGGIPVGVLSLVASGKSDVFQAAQLRSPIDFSRLELVFGVK